jgi:hypothetical protein
MLARQPKRQPSCDAVIVTSRDLARKEALRAHVDQLSPDKQREFVLAALLLIKSREPDATQSREL